MRKKKKANIKGKVKEKTTLLRNKEIVSAEVVKPDRDGISIFIVVLGFVPLGLRVAACLCG